MVLPGGPGGRVRRRQLYTGPPLCFRRRGGLLLYPQASRAKRRRAPAGCEQTSFERVSVDAGQGGRAPRGRRTERYVDRVARSPTQPSAAITRRAKGEYDAANSKLDPLSALGGEGVLCCTQKRARAKRWASLVGNEECPPERVSVEAGSRRASTESEAYRRVCQPRAAGTRNSSGAQPDVDQYHNHVLRTAFVLDNVCPRRCTTVPAPFVSRS